MQDQFAFMSNFSSLRAWAFIQLGYDKKMALGLFHTAIVLTEDDR